MTICQPTRHRPNECDAPLWVHEHGLEYDVPDTITKLEGIEDLSWHNDECPCFGLFRESVGLNHHLLIWVGHPNRDRRTYGPSDGRYLVSYFEDGGHEWQDLYSGDDDTEAVRVFMAYLPTFFAEVAATRARLSA